MIMLPYPEALAISEEGLDVLMKKLKDKEPLPADAVQSLMNYIFLERNIFRTRMNDFCNEAKHYEDVMWKVLMIVGEIYARNKY